MEHPVERRFDFDLVAPRQMCYLCEVRTHCLRVYSSALGIWICICIECANEITKILVGVKDVTP